MTEVFIYLFLLGIPEDGHKEKRGTAKASQGEIWDKHRPAKIDKTIVTTSAAIYDIFLLSLRQYVLFNFVFLHLVSVSNQASQMQSILYIQQELVFHWYSDLNVKLPGKL